MTDLLQQLSQFLNLKSLVTVTVPGLLLTLALVIYFNPPKCQSDSENCWYCQGQQKDSKDTDKSADTDPTVRNKGSYFASTLTWSTANELYRHLGTEIPACDVIPKYLVTGTYLTANKETSQNLGDLQVADARTLLQNLDACSVALNQALKNLKAKDKAIQPTITTLNASVTTLATKLESAEEASNGVLAASIRTYLDRDKKRLETANEEDQHLSADISRIGDTGTTGSLLNQISAMQTTIAGNVGQAVPVEKKPDPPTWQVVATQIANNIWLFLVVSIFVGQILDPIQRSLVSAEPLRGFLFPFLNFLYSRAVPWGSLRSGDRHYPTESPSDVRDKDHSLDFYEPNYAIGSGLITETEYVTLRDRFYSESQMTTGLILPILALGAVGLIRAACCGGIPAWTLALLVAVDLLGFICLVVAAWQFLEPFGQQGKDFDAWRKFVFNVDAGDKISALVWRAVIALLIFALLGFIAGKLLTSSLVGLIAGSVPPTIFALYIFGMDRLHNFYSELQSRIVGSFVKQSESQIAKFVDIVTNDKSKDKFIKRLQETEDQATDLLAKLKASKKFTHKSSEPPSREELTKKLDDARRKELELVTKLRAFPVSPLAPPSKEELIQELKDIQKEISEILVELIKTPQNPDKQERS